MNKQLDFMPCGFLTVSKDGSILSCNQTLSILVGYSKEQLVGRKFHFLLSESAKVFIELYFFPLIIKQQQVEEMYLSLKHKNGREIPVLMNASTHHQAGEQEITCVLLPMQKREEYENQLLVAKKAAEDAWKEKEQANKYLEETLHNLQIAQQKVINVNQQNQQFKIDIQNELELAKKIQEKSLTRPIVTAFVEIDSFYQASRELSGDNYGFYQINDHQYGAILLDVMGNGISSALISMSLHPLFQRLITKGFQPNKVMEELDHYLHTLFHYNQDSWHYCTAIYLVIDTQNRTVQCSNAGHPAAILQNSSGQQREFKSTSPPIGTFKGISFKTTEYKYERNSRIMLYTDGVSESIGERNLRVLLQRNASDTLGNMKEIILLSLQKEQENRKYDDDQCFILIDLK